MTALIRELRDGLVLLLLPAVLAMLPWRVAFGAVRRLAALSGTPTDAERLALEAARAFGGLRDVDASTWLSRRRVLLWVDRIDLFLAIFRPDSMVDERLGLVGPRWPGRPCLALSFHFGAGMLALQSIAAAGPPCSFLTLRLARANFPGSYMAWTAARLRSWATQRAGRAPVVETGGARQAIVQALRTGRSVCALLDVPDPAPPHAPIALLGRPTRVPLGVLEAAREAGVPVVVFVASIDPDSGSRRVRRVMLDPAQSPETQAAAAVAVLADAIEGQPFAWHLWPQYAAVWQRDGASASTAGPSDRVEPASGGTAPAAGCVAGSRESSHA